MESIVEHLNRLPSKMVETSSRKCSKKCRYSTWRHNVVNSGGARLTARLDLKGLSQV